MRAFNPTSGEYELLADKCLPFGHSISCSIFQDFSDSLKHIVEYQIGRTDCVTNYLDDFLFAAPTQAGCNRMVRIFLNLCDRLGVPVALEKTEYARPKIVFLGILLDGSRFMLAVPEEKRLKAINWLDRMIDSQKSTVKEMERLTGLLNFLSKAVVPGRAFTRRMYAKFNVQKTENKLRSFHHVRLDREFKQDCIMWKTFLQRCEHATIARPYLDILNKEDTAIRLQFHSDATANGQLGFGIIFESSWSYQKWEPGFVANFNPTIQFLELYALCVGVFTWADKLVNRRVIVFTDNEPSMNMINNTSGGCKFCMTLIRKLMMKCMDFNLRIFAEHVKGTENYLSDSLSRMKIDLFKEQAKTDGRIIDAEPTPINMELWPLSTYWKENCVPLI